MLGIFYILLFWLIGNIIARLSGNYLPGNVVGMVLLFCALHLKIVPAEKVRPAAQFLLRNMALFFVPFGVGLMISYRMILDNFWAILIACIVSTVLVMLVTGRIFQTMHRR